MTRRRLPVVVLARARPRRAGGRRGVAARPPASRRRSPSRTSREARTAAIAFDLQTGETLFAEHDALSLAPASNEKLAVTYAALVRSAPTSGSRPTCSGAGEQDGSVWRGTSCSSGTATRRSRARTSPHLAAQVRAAGIRRVTGGVFGDESFFDARRTAPGWKSWFYVNESPPLSALTVDRGTLPGPHLARTRRSRRRCSSATRCAGPGSPSAARGSAPSTATTVPLASVDSAPLSRDRQVHGPRERQLHGRARS